jgi:hypothetical protein
MMEYTVASFIPVILAAVSATTLSRLVFSDAPAFVVPEMAMGSLRELMLVLVLGVIAGALSAGFIHAVQTIAGRARALGIWWRMLLAGVLMGGIGLMLPGVMGIGYDSVETALNGGFAITLLVMLLVGKLLATSLCIGLGVPGGMIGPALFIGAMLGALIAKLALFLSLGPDSHVGFFALLGMGAMMSGSLQAPLAALTAMLELTHSPSIILPGMLAVVISGVTASEVFGKQSLFITMLRSAGLDYDANPVFQALRRIGVASVMDRSFVQVGQRLSREQARICLAEAPTYLLISGDDQSRVLMPAVELAKYLESPEVADDEEDVDLFRIPAARLDTDSIHLQASLQEAWTLFEQSSTEALLVERMTAPGIVRVYGVLTPETVEKSYRY